MDAVPHRRDTRSACAPAQIWLGRPKPASPRRVRRGGSHRRRAEQHDRADDSASTYAVFAQRAHRACRFGQADLGERLPASCTRVPTPDFSSTTSAGIP
jgi:hypothetical protein